MPLAFNIEFIKAEFQSIFEVQYIEPPQVANKCVVCTGNDITTSHDSEREDEGSKCDSVKYSIIKYFEDIMKNILKR